MSWDSAFLQNYLPDVWIERFLSGLNWQKCKYRVIENSLCRRDSIKFFKNDRPCPTYISDKDIRPFGKVASIQHIRGNRSTLFALGTCRIMRA
jgi:hypothetical protein